MSESMNMQNASGLKLMVDIDMFPSNDNFNMDQPSDPDDNIKYYGMMAPQLQRRTPHVQTEETLFFNTNMVTESRFVPDTQSKRPSDDSQQKKKANSLIVQLYVRRFIGRFLKTRRAAAQLTPYHHSIINDQACSQSLTKLDQKVYRLNGDKPAKVSYLQRQLRRFKRKIEVFFLSAQLETFRELSQSIPIISPESTFKFIWDILLAMMRVYLLLFIPIELAFNSKLLFSYLKYPTMISTGCLVIDLGLNFNTSYYEYGQIVNNRSQIIMNYISGGFFMDMISSVSLFAVSVSEISDCNLSHCEQNERKWSYLWLLTILLQVQDISHVKKKFEEMLNFSAKTSLLIDLGKLIVLLFFSEHMYTCIWYYVGHLGQSYEYKNWIDTYDLTHASYLKQYLTGFYFTTVTMITVGYGDIVPGNDIERLVVILFMFSSQIQLSYTVSSLWNIIIQYNSTQEEQLNKLRIINRFMQQKKISFNLQYKIREYLNYFWQENEDQVEPQNAIIGQLSQELKDQLMMEANALVLRDCTLFSEYFSTEIKRKCIRLIKQLTLFPETTIESRLSEEERDDQFIYFIEKGTIEVLLDSQNKSKFHSNRITTITYLTKGDNFGLIDFIKGTNSYPKYKSQGFTKLVYLSRREFTQLLKEFPEDYEQFCQLKHLIEFSGFPSNLKVSCYACQSKQHQIDYCPIVHYIPDREFYMKKQAFSGEQQRDPPKALRIYPERFNSWKDQEFLNEVAMAFQLENQNIIEKFGLVSEREKEFHTEQSQTSSSSDETPKKPEIKEPMQNSFEIVLKTPLNQHMNLQLPVISSEQDSSSSSSQQKSRTSSLKKSSRFVNTNFSTQKNVLIVNSYRADLKSSPRSPRLAPPFPNQQRRKSVALENIIKRKSSKKELSSLLPIQKARKAFKKLKILKQITDPHRDDTNVLELQHQTAQQLRKQFSKMLVKRQAKFHEGAELEEDSLLIQLMRNKYLTQQTANDPIFQEFDQCRVFKRFQPQNNITQVIKLGDQVEQISQYVYTLIQKFSKYLLFPYNFISKYKLANFIQTVTYENNQKKIRQVKQKIRSKIGSKISPERPGARRQTKAFQIIKSLNA